MLAGDRDLGARRGLRTAQAYSPRALTDGERWTAEALGALRAERYRPSAWAWFIRDSLWRSRATRRARPRLARQARRWGAVGAAAWLASCRLARGRPTVRLRPLRGLAWWFAVWRMLDWHLGMAEGGDGRPRPHLSPADAVTLARLWLVPVAIGVRRSPRGLPAVIVLGALTDALDGALARRRGRTRLGRDLDTIADLCFLTTAGFAARAAGRLPRPGVWALGMRHAAGVALATGAAFGRARRPAIRARPAGGALRVSGLALCAGDRPRAGTIILLAGCLTPPRSTAPARSLA
jgi:hypothetical protein